MISIVLLGGGNVALHLYSAFRSSSAITVVQYYNRSLEHIAHLQYEVSLTDKLSELAVADIYIIAVKDDAITEVAQQLPTNTGLVVHTSGSASLDVLKSHPRRGCFYPLQTFTKGKELDFRQIPLCIETASAADLDLLQRLGAAIGEWVVPISTPQRQALHVAAVFVNNFTNHLYQIGYEICSENGLPFHMLYPLIQETVAKIETISPFLAQTGPARRKDDSTLMRHQQLLDNENHKAIYKLLSESIKTTYGKEL